MGDEHDGREDLFDDMPEHRGALEIDRDWSDREILFGIWTLGEIGDLAADEAWAILYGRYPAEPRFLLLNAYEELRQQVPDVWTPSYFLKKLIRVRRDGPGLVRPIRDVLTVAWADVFREDVPKGARREIAELAGALGIPAKQMAPWEDGRSPALPEPDRNMEAVSEAHARLSEFARAVLREFHDKTVGGALIDASRSGSPARSYEELVSDARGRKRAYAATERYAGGDLVEHPKFGLGVVTCVVAGRAEIVFEDGARKLVCG